MFGEPKLKRLAEDQTPVYRICHLGPQACSFQELLAVLIGGSTQLEVAEAITNRWGTPLNLMSVPLVELEDVHGVGLIKSTRIKAAFELGRLASITSLGERPTIHSPADAAALVQYEMSVLEQEELRVILLDTRNHVMGIVTVYKGSLNSSQVRVGELFKEAIRRNAAALIVIHNHPSGDPTPSPDDIALTRAIVEAGKLIDIDVLDHLVIGTGRFVSLKEKGLGFN
ncbi:DNA repair protein RadC [Chloroflexota bacterium]